MAAKQEAVTTITKNGALIGIVYRNNRTCVLYKCEEMTEEEIARLLSWESENS